MGPGPPLSARRTDPRGPFSDAKQASDPLSACRTGLRPLFCTQLETPGVPFRTQLETPGVPFRTQLETPGVPFRTQLETPGVPFRGAAG